MFISLLLRGVLGGYYEGNMMVRCRFVDTPGRGVVSDPLDVRRAGNFAVLKDEVESLATTHLSKIFR